MNYVGTCVAKSSKQLKSGVFYSICVEDSNGDEEWFRSGKKEPPVEKGQMCKFDYNEDKYGKHIDLSTLKTKEGAPTQTAGAKKAHNANSDKMSKEEWADKDKKIGYMAASKTAVPLVVAALEAEFLGIPKSKKPAEKLGLFLEYVREVTDEIYRTTEGIPERYDEIMSAGDSTKASKRDFDTDLEKEADDFHDDVEDVGFGEEGGEDDDWS